MPITDAFVLAPDVQLVRVADLADDLRHRLIADDDAYAIARPGARVPAKLLDVGTARLVKEFAEPSKIVDAVVRASRAIGADEAAFLAAAYPVLRQLIRGGLLVPADRVEESRLVARHRPGDAVCACTVRACLHVLSDTEVYSVRTASGEDAVLKIARDSEAGQLGDFTLESRVLARLEGAIAPKLLSAGEAEGRPYLLMEFCRGIDAARAAADIRDTHGSEARARLGDLACAIAETYSTLHAARVLHGDVHEGNLIVGKGQRITLLDFGLARMLDDDAVPAHRGGMGYYFEPEYARAKLDDTQRPPATLAGEQYVLAAMLYALLADAAYLEFAIDEAGAFRQIVDEQPLAFAQRGTAPWPAVEEVLRRALAKRPEDRYPVTVAFAMALRHAVSDNRLWPEPARGRVRKAGAPGRSLLRRVAAEVGFDGGMVRTGLTTTPTASVAFGAAGIAYALYRMSLIDDDPRALALADAWSFRAVTELPRRRAFHDDLLLTDGAIDRNSLHHGAGGVHVVRALVTHSQGDFAGMDDAVQRLRRLPGKARDTLDFATGVVGMLVGLTLVVEAAPASALVEYSALLRAGERCRRAIAEALGARPPISEDTDFVNLGMAHGWAGVLYSLLRWHEATGAPLPAETERRLNELAALGEPYDRGLRWPWRGRGEDGEISSSYMPGWCNGSAGFAHLWMAAHAVFGDQRYLALAESAAFDTCDSSGSGAYDLCCGAAGSAYAALALHRSTGDASWLNRARKLVEVAVADAAGQSEIRPALFKGALGVVLLQTEIEAPHLARMPLFEAEGWPMRSLAVPGRTP